MTKTELLTEIVKKQDELIAFYSKDITDNAMFLKIHGIEASNEDYEKGVLIRNELSDLKKQLEECKEGVIPEYFKGSVWICPRCGKFHSWLSLDEILSLPIDVPSEEEIIRECLPYNDEYPYVMAKWAINEIIRRNGKDIK